VASDGHVVASTGGHILAAREPAKLPASTIEQQLEKINDFLRYETVNSNI
jgi:hypothetical protein